MLSRECPPHLDLVGVNLGERDRVGDGDTALVLLLQSDVGRRLVQADTCGCMFAHCVRRQTAAVAVTRRD